MDTLRSGTTEALLGGREKWKSLRCWVGKEVGKGYTAELYDGSTAGWEREVEEAALLGRRGGGQLIHCGVVRRKHCWVGETSERGCAAG